MIFFFVAGVGGGCVGEDYMFSVYHGLFVLPPGGIGRLCYAIVALPGHHLSYVSYKYVNNTDREKFKFCLV